MYDFKSKDKNIAQQVTFIRSRYSHFNVTHSHTHLKAVGEMKPTSRSSVYQVEIKYHLRCAPEIRVLNPELVINFNGDSIPHVYPGNRLCLFQPKYREFAYSDYLTDTVFPWTSLWIYHYEVWHTTGEWLGGGEHPKPKNK